MEEKIKQLSKGEVGKLVIEVLENVEEKIADIRTPLLNVRSEIGNEVRLGVIQALETLLVEKLKIYSGEVEPPDNNEHI